jgi:hypothetical protein
VVEDVSIDTDYSIVVTMSGEDLERSATVGLGWKLI